VNVRIGGFYRAPVRAELAPLAERLRWARDAALKTVRWVSGFDFPDFTHDHPLLALSSPGTYAIESGMPTSTRILDGQGGGGRSFPVSAFERQRTRKAEDASLG
jgi:hypothetical protein